MKHFTFFCATVMSLTILTGILTGCKESNNSSIKQTIETTTQTDSSASSASSDADSAEAVANKDNEKSNDNQPVPAQDKEQEPALVAPEIPSATEPELPALPEVEPEISEPVELQAPTLPDTELESPAVPELTAPALTEPESPAVPELESPALTEPAAPTVPELGAPALTEPESPAVPELEAPALTEPTAPAVPELETPALTEPTAPAVPELEAPALTEPESPAVPELETPALTEPAAPTVPELEAPALTEPTAPAVPELETPALTEPAAPAVPELETPALTEPTAPAPPELEAPALTEPAAPAVPELETPALTEPAAPATPELDAPALTEQTPPTLPKLEIPALEEIESKAPVASDAIQTEDMGLAELPDSAKAMTNSESQTQAEKPQAVQPETIGPKPTQITPAQPVVQSAPSVPQTLPTQPAKTEIAPKTDSTPVADPSNSANTAVVNEPKWESKNGSGTNLNSLKEEASKLVQTEMQKLDDSLDLNLVEPDDAAESRVIPPPKRDVSNASAPATLPSENVNNPLLEDIPQQETVQPNNNIVAESKANAVQPTAPQTTASQPNEIVKPPFDPIKENGPIFVGWGVPRVALVITGQQNGYLEPCGCAGLDRMKGGLSRRYSFIKGLKDKGWPVIALDVGGMCNSFGKQAELKFHTTASALRAMGYNAIALGKAELGFPAADILSEVVNADGTPGMFVSANVSVFERNAGMPQTYKILEANGLKFGITSVLCKSAQNFNQNDEILLSQTKESLNIVMPILKAKSDIRILLSHGTVEEAINIAKDYPDFQVIVTAGGNPEPPAKPVILPSGQYIITVGEKGMCSIVLGFFEKGVLKYQRVPHDSRFEQSDAIRQMMQSYQDQLKELWLDGLGIRPVPQTDASRGANVGPKKCQTCHEYQYDVWKKSKHAHAFKSLEDAKPSRDFDPECVCCHVVGWHRHLYFPYQKGYVKPGQDDYLKNVSCEACHGPGEAHIAAESSSNVENQNAQRAKMHIDLKYAKDKMCGDCHDLDNSPNFDPDKYWELVKHHDPEDDE